MGLWVSAQRRALKVSSHEDHGTSLQAGKASHGHHSLLTRTSTTCLHGSKVANVHFRLMRCTSHVLRITIMLINFLLLKKQVTTVFAGKALNLILSKDYQVLICCSDTVLDSVTQSKIRMRYLSKRP